MSRCPWEGSMTGAETQEVRRGRGAMSVRLGEGGWQGRALPAMAGRGDSGDGARGWWLRRFLDKTPGLGE